MGGEGWGLPVSSEGGQPDVAKVYHTQVEHLEEGRTKRM